MATETIQRGYKVKLYPSPTMRDSLYRHAGYARFAYNWGLAYAKQQVEETGKFPGWMTIKKQWNAIKYTEFPWSRELCQMPAQEGIRNLGAAFSNFWRDRKKANGRKAKFPKFKSRYGRKSFRLYYPKVEHGRLTLPGLGVVKYRQPDYIPLEDVRHVSVTISERAGDWYATVLVEEEMEITRATGQPVGVDLGVKELAVASTGDIYANPKALAYYQKKLKRLQRKLSRQQRGGSNYHKTKQQIASVHAKIANIRQWHTHNASAAIVGRGLPDNERPAAVVLEDLNVAGMVKNHKLAGAVSDANMREMRRQIEYKAAWGGADVLTVDRFYPSSKTCSNCGSIREKLSLSERTFRCPDCGFVIDRDLNAARNLERYAR